MQRYFFFKGWLFYFTIQVLFTTAAPAQNSAAATKPDSLRRSEKNNGTPVYNERTQQAVRLDIEYYAGMAAYNRRHWTHAILTFERILAVNPNFRELSKKLAIAERNLKRERTENILSRYYQDAKLAVEREDFGWARRALEKINRLNPNYRDAPALLAEIAAITSRSNDTLQTTERFNGDAALQDSLYKAGIRAYAQGEWLQAVVNFEKLQLIAPNNVEFNSRLALAWEKLLHTQTAAAKQDTHERRVPVGMALASIIAVSLFCFIGLRPTARARFELWRGHEQAAAAIYEKLLAQNPQRVKLYAPLADIYLRLGRNDERALKVYKSVVHFNLATARRDEINGIVAQKYLTEGRMDTDAIEVLEGALQSEMRKQGRSLVTKT